MNIELKPIGDIIPYEGNPRINREAIQFVKNSIEKFGFKQPIVLDKNNVIVAGHTRYYASLELNLQEIPCVIAAELSDSEIKAYRLADNKTGEAAEWDFDLLSKEVQEIDLDLELYGFSDDDMAEMEDLFTSRNVSFIDDLCENTFASGIDTDRTTFVVSFAFPVIYQEGFDQYIKDNGKQQLVDGIISNISKEGYICQDVEVK